jgi:hypothetical protein
MATSTPGTRQDQPLPHAEANLNIDQHLQSTSWSAASSSRMGEIPVVLDVNEVVQAVLGGHSSFSTWPTSTHV